jgi:NAD(P)-dependent dehydrogenase (short-subunit alcohol dehydrogenase family)
VRKAASALGSIDTLVLNAAYQQQEPDILKITDEHLENTFLTNINAMVWMTQEHCVCLFRLEASSSLLRLSRGYDPSPYLVDYAMTKSAQVSYVRSMAKQLGPGDSGKRSCSRSYLDSVADQWRDCIREDSELPGGQAARTRRSAC